VLSCGDGAGAKPCEQAGARGRSGASGRRRGSYSQAKPLADSDGSGGELGLKRE
jgi:hypothetical protein